jgi:hypothetical protein
MTCASTLCSLSGADRAIAAEVLGRGPVAAVR